MMSMRKMLSEHGKKVMAVVSAILMITFFLPSLRGSGTSANLSKAVATVYDGQNISELETASAVSEWDQVRHILIYATSSTDEQPRVLAAILGAPAVNQIDINPKAFMLLIEEAKHLGVGVSQDQLQDMLHNHIPNFPDEADPAYDRDTHAVYDLLLVNNLLERVSGVYKVSQPESLRLLALNLQDVSVNIAELSAKRHLADTTQPTDQEIAAQYAKFRDALPNQISADNPLGFGYLLPDRVRLQYIGFRSIDIREHVKASRSSLDWDVAARRYYRNHLADFPVPTTQALVLGAPEWEKLPPDVAAKVYNEVYGAAATDLAKKLEEWVNDQLSADYAAWHDAVSRKQPAPATSYGAAFDTDDYMRHFAAAAEQQFGVGPVMGIINYGWKSADDLALLEGIGKAVTASNPPQPFAQYATTAGDQFKAAEQLPSTQRLGLWQPSQDVYVGGAAASSEFYVFRLAAMDASHSMTLADARDSVIADLRMEQAWNATLTEANKLLAKAQQVGTAAALADVADPPPVMTTGLFNIGSAQKTGTIADSALQPETVRAVAGAASDLLSAVASTPKSVALLKLPLDRRVALVELAKVKPDWQDTGDQLRQQDMAATEMREMETGMIRQGWCDYDKLVERTNYKDLPKE